MENIFLDDLNRMFDSGWTSTSPKQGTYTIFNLTPYSSGESEVTVTTVKDSEPKTRKKRDVEAIHDALLNNVPLEGDESELAFMKATEPNVISDIDKDENKTRSLRRTRSTIRKKIIEGQLDHFLTLTYQENKTDLKECWKDWKKFIRAVQKKYPNLKYLVICERQKRGAVHFHAAVSGYMHANTLRALWLKTAGSGNIDIKRKKHNQSMHGLAKYITKYLTKQYDEIEDFKNIYRCSRNIKLKQIKFYLSKEFAMTRARDIDNAIKLWLKEINQHWEDSNGLFSCQWASTLQP